MKIACLQALFISGLFACTSVVAASEQASVSGRDMAWMKQQQRELQEFKDSMKGQPPELPTVQQDLISKLQNEIAGQRQTEQDLPMLQDAARYNVPATIRGLVNNDLRQTANAIFELAKKDNKIGVQIDPTQFSDYHITTVPALVVTCPGSFDIIRGSLPLKQALEKVAREGDCSATARQILENAQ